MSLRNDYVATSYIYDRSKDQFLLVFHRKLRKWMPPGGHLGEGEQPQIGALREVAEEIGVKGVIISLLETPNVNTDAVPQLPSPFCILYEEIPDLDGNVDHMHIDFVYVIEIDPNASFDTSVREISTLKWFPANHVDRLDTFPNVKAVCQAISAMAKRDKG